MVIECPLQPVVPSHVKVKTSFFGEETRCSASPRAPLGEMSSLAARLRCRILRDLRREPSGGAPLVKYSILLMEINAVGAPPPSPRRQ